jgi:mannose/cellobiose epimerase-like protein (N-acyl-D-glucosamine 2-epimerase family)
MKRTHVGRHSLEFLKEHYRNYLFKEYLPFWQKFGIDHELGGFMCGIDHDGKQTSDSKLMWYQGRGLWTYSYLYRCFGGEENLQVATKAKDFLLENGRDKDGNWVQSLTRQGDIELPATRRGYGALFVAEGMQAYSHATGDQQALDVALEALEQGLKLFDDAERFIDEGYIPHTYKGQRPLGSHMVLILILTQILEHAPSPRLEALADKIVDAIMNKFWNPEYRLLNEVLAHDYSRPDDSNESFVYLGHAIETLWMLLPEALRRNDHALFELVSQRFRRHLEVSWDDVYGGFLLGGDLHGAPIYDKVLWQHEEVMIGCLILIEHTDWDWPADWFERTFDYAEAKFSLKQYGYPLYLYGGDRKVSFAEHVTRKENYHHPRCIMRNLLAVENILSRGGAVSDRWKGK